MLFGHVYGDPELFEPKQIDFNVYRKRIEIFVGDRWIVLGDLDMAIRGRTVEISWPDAEQTIDAALNRRDGTAEWLDWGALLN